MPIYALPNEIIFPPGSHAEPGGLLAVGGDLSPERLLTAYANGIFPWYSKGDPILWYCTNPRLILPPQNLVVQKSMRPILNGDRFKFTVDTAFEEVIRACSVTKRKGQKGTWILKEMIQAYTHLHELGFAHSVEVREGEKLVGGLYGLSMGRTFFGESMFAAAPNASKFGFIHFVRGIEKLGFDLIDCQQTTSHLQQFGAYEVPLDDYLRRLQKSLKKETLRGKWTDFGVFSH